MKTFSSRTFALGVVIALLFTMAAVFTPSGASAAGGSITLRSVVCPADYPGASSSLNGLAANCTAPAGQVPLTITQGLTLIDQTNTNSDGTINYVGFTGGEIIIDETAPAGTFVRAFCAIYSDTIIDRTYRLYDNPIDELLQTGENFDCVIYNVGYPNQPQPTPTPDQSSLSTVYLVRDICPVKFDAFAADMNGLALNCHDSGPDGVGFVLSDTANPAIPGSTVNGMVTWSNVPASQVSISEAATKGSLPARAFCNQRSNTGDETGFGEVTLFSNIAKINITPGYDLFCDWYDRKLAPGTVVTGINQDGVTQTANDSTATDTANGNATNGNANNGNANNGNATNTTGTPVASQNPTGAASVTMNVFNCPPGYDVLNPSANPAADCTAAAASASFTLAGSGGSPVIGVSDDGGALVFSSLAAGRYDLTEAMPAGITSAFIDSCASSARGFDQPLFTPLTRIGSSGRLAFNLLNGESLTCGWFNAPAKDSTAAGTSVKINALTCPGTSVVRAQCTPDASGLAFTFTPSDGATEPATLTADVSGTAVGRVKPGTYAFTGSNGAFCIVDSDAFDDSGNLIVGSDAIAISVYSCGA